MKAALFAVLFAATFVAVLGQHAPDNCRELNISRFSNVTASSPGNSLEYCARSERQCCSHEYFTQRIRYLRAELLSGLREQIDVNGDVLRGIDNGLNIYILRVFIPRLLSLLELPINLSQNVSTLNTTIRNNFFIRSRHPGEANFTASGFTEDFIFSQINLLIHSVISPLVPRNNGSGMPALNTRQLVCARERLRGLVNATTKNRVDRSFQQLRLAATAIKRARTWFESSFNITKYFNPLNACIRGMIRLRCQDCVENIPRTCRGVCNAASYGCYAVIQNGFSGQFNVLWNVTDQLVRISREAVRNISDVLPNHYLTVNITNFASLFGVLTDISRNCSIQLNLSTGGNHSFPRPRNFTASDLMQQVPQGIRNNASNLLRRGLVHYGTNGPFFCREETNRNCWNGNRTVSQYVPTFTNTTINGQVNNPFVDVNIAELRTQVSELGNPVTDFLHTESFTEVAPQELVIPEDEPYTGGSSGLMVSTFLMVVMTILYAAFA